MCIRDRIYKRLGLAIPEPPQFDGTTQQIIQTFILATRARQYIEGNPLPLSVRDISDVVTAHPIDVPRGTLDYIIFALDDMVMDERRKVAQNS